MSVSSTANRVSYVGNGVTTAFSFPYYVFAFGDLVVREVLIATGAESLKALTTDYTVSGTPDASGVYASGVTVHATTAPSSLVKWVIYRDPFITQPAIGVQNDPLPVKAMVELPLDRLTLIEQRLRELCDRSIHQPDGDAAGVMTMPPQLQRASKLAAFDANGDFTTNLSDATAMQAAATAAATSLASFQALIGTYGVPFASVHNIFELLTPTEIATIRASDNSLNIAAKVQTAMTANPNSTWFWPAGWYFMDAGGTPVISLPQGIRWIGAGIGVTNIKMGGGTGAWAIEQLNPNGVTNVKGFSTDNITFRFTYNGIRVNSNTAGIDDTSGTMYYVERSVFRQTEFLYNGSPNTYTTLSLNKAFNCGVYECNFNAGSLQLHVRGCDLFTCRDSRFDQATNGAILDESVGTFGTNSVYDHLDMNQANDFFIRWNNRQITITNCHMELDSPRAGSGSGGNMIAAMDCVTGGGSFHTRITGNLVAIFPYADYWLRYNSDNPYSLIVEDNKSPGPMVNVSIRHLGIGGLPYFNNSSTRVVCSHRTNMSSEQFFPMNNGDFSDPHGIDAIYLNASRPGITFGVGLGGVLYGIKCSSGDIYFPANADTTKVIEWSDWNGLPANQLIGTFSVLINSYAAVAGQVLSYKVLDNGSVLATGTTTQTTANKFYQTSALSSTLVSTKLQIQVWNADTTRNGDQYIRNVEVRFG